MKSLQLTMLSLVAFGLAIPAAARPVTPRTGPRDGQVLSVAVQPSPGAAEVVINLRGAVEVRDFTLHGPARLVLDLTGATLGTAPTLYDGVERGGIRNIRVGQFGPNVVRVVVDLAELKDYQIVREGDAVRVRFGTERSFLAWSSLAPAAMSEPMPAGLATAARAPEVRVPASDPAPQQISPDRLITVSYDNADIADVVAGFAAFSGRSIVLGAGITSVKINTEIKNKPWRSAFAAILAANGLSATETTDGIIRVDSPKALAALDSLEPLETRLVRINYASAAAIAKNMSGIITKNRGSVVADSATNALIITDTRSKISGVEDFVKGLDVRTPSVSIQAKIILVDREDIEGLGIKYDLGASTVGEGAFFNTLLPRIDPTTGQPFAPATTAQVVDLGGTSVAAVGNAQASIQNPALNVILSTVIGGMSLTSFVQATQQINLTDVQAEPIITTLDNTLADILVGEETPVRIVDAGSAGAPGTQAVATVSFKQTGIRLTATPHVTNNRQIVMLLHTERSAVQAVAASDLGFNFAKQTADNKLLVNDGETAVIGGLTITEVTKTKSGIPLLMDLPLIGGLFGFNSSDERRRDLIILVTPRIVDDAPASATP